MICAACQNASVKQDYADTVYCPSCNSKWKNYSLSGTWGSGGGNVKSYRKSKYAQARADWNKGEYKR